MKIRIKVPATVANIGSGFDSIGMAVDIFNETTFEFKKGKKEVKIFIEGEGGEELVKKDKNLVFRVFKKFCKKSFSSIIIRQKNNIPLRRGLGSSATAIISGIIGAYIFSGRKIDKVEILKKAVKIEGHPDNITPAIFGGINIVLKEKEDIRYLKILPNFKISILLLVPDFEVFTEKARKILPEKVNFKDAIFNLQRFGFLVSSFYKKEKNNLVFGVKDFLHQKYRLKLIRGGKEVIEAALKMGIASGISGSGPTIFSFVEKRKEKQVANLLKSKWNKINNRIEIKEYICKINNKGTVWRVL